MFLRPLIWRWNHRHWIWILVWSTILFFHTECEKFSQSPFPYLQNENIWLNSIHTVSLPLSEIIINCSSILEHTIFFIKPYLSISCRCCICLWMSTIVWTIGNGMLIFGALNNIVTQFVSYVSYLMICHYFLFWRILCC